LAIAAIVVAVLGGALAVVRAAQTLLRSLNGPSLTAPGTTRLQIAAGRWIIFEHTGSQQNFGPVQTTEDGPTTIQVSDVRITDTEGNEQSVRDVTGTQTITVNNKKFTGAVEFSVPADGTYDVEIRGTAPVDVRLARPISDQAKAAAPWFVLAGVCLILLILGVVFTVLPTNPATPVPRVVSAPGWYQDPWAPMQFRWWDGRTWTPHTAPWPTGGPRVS
jgi:hypothetical protein